MCACEAAKGRKKVFPFGRSWLRNSGHDKRMSRKSKERKNGKDEGRLNKAIRICESIHEEREVGQERMDDEEVENEVYGWEGQEDNDETREKLVEEEETEEERIARLKEFEERWNKYKQG